jgi:hypothetical protein
VKEINTVDKNEINEIEKNDIESQEKKVYTKIDPILRLYDEGRISKIELVEKLAEAFYDLEE